MPRVDVKGISTPPAYTPTLVGLALDAEVMLMAVLPLPCLIAWIGIDAHDDDAHGRTRRSDTDSMPDHKGKKRIGLLGYQYGFERSLGFFPSGKIKFGTVQNETGM